MSSGFLQQFFEKPMPDSSVSSTYVEDTLNSTAISEPKSSSMVVWIGDEPILSEDGLVFFSEGLVHLISVRSGKEDSLLRLINDSKPTKHKHLRWGDVNLELSEILVEPEDVEILRECGLLVV